jgi:hypothetical protein
MAELAQTNIAAKRKTAEYKRNELQVIGRPDGST